MVQSDGNTNRVEIARRFVMTPEIGRHHWYVPLARYVGKYQLE